MNGLHRRTAATYLLPPGSSSWVLLPESHVSYIKSTPDDATLKLGLQRGRPKDSDKWHREVAIDVKMQPPFRWHDLSERIELVELTACNSTSPCSTALLFQTNSSYGMDHFSVYVCLPVCRITQYIQIVFRWNLLYTVSQKNASTL